MARGNIDYDQLQSAVRQGNGSKFQMFGGGSVVTNAPLLYDANGNAVSGAVAQLVPTSPADATKFLSGSNPPTWASPSGSGGNIILAPVAYASMVGASVSGRLYPNLTDIPLSAYDDGSKWNFMMYGVPGFVTLPPASTSGYAWGSTQGSAAVTANGIWYASSPKNSGDQLRFLYKNAAYPVASYTFTVGFIADTTINNTGTGIALSDGTKFLVFHIGSASAQLTTAGVDVSLFSNQTTFSANEGAARSVIGVNRPFFLTLQDDLSATISMWFSDDITNLQKYLIYSGGRTSLLTPSRIGISQDVNNAAWGISSLIFHMVGTGGFTP